MSVDWAEARSANIARYSGFDFAFMRRSDRGDVAVVRRRLKDVWLHDGRAKRRLTFDGQNYTAAIAPSGILLLSKPDGAGAFSIWRQMTDGRSEKLTNGPRDVEPAFSSDGQQWAYVDYARMGIMVCSTESGRCRLLRREPVLPNMPTFSPDGRLVAYVTQLNRARMTVISVGDGFIRGSWDAYPSCAPVWSSDTTLWSLESASGQYVWSERDVNGSRTGNHFAGSSESLEQGEVRCSPKDVAPGSPWFKRIDVEDMDTSRVLLEVR